MTDETLVSPRCDLSLSFAKANLYGGLLPLPIVLALGWFYIWLWGVVPLVSGAAQLAANRGAALVAVGLIIVGLVAHEALHALTWVYASGKSWRAVEFGLDWKTLTPYTHFKELLPVSAYRLGALMPGLALGLLPALLGCLTGWAGAWAFGLLFIIGAGGDMLMLWLLRGVSTGALVEDHPSRVGCYVLESYPD